MPAPLYPTVRPEIDLRANFDSLVHGATGGLAHGHWVILRLLRRNSDGVPVDCVCRDPQTNEPTVTCSYCDGEGYLWDEHWAKAYSVYVGADGGLTRKNIRLQPGVLKVEYKVFYLDYRYTLQHEDKIIEVELDKEGRVVSPYRRVVFYKPETIAEMRSDNGRLEFWTIYCREEDALRSNRVRV